MKGTDAQGKQKKARASSVTTNRIASLAENIKKSEPDIQMEELLFMVSTSFKEIYNNGRDLVSCVTRC